jgi:hypothetical protein
MLHYLFSIIYYSLLFILLLITNLFLVLRDDGINSMVENKQNLKNDTYLVKKIGSVLVTFIIECIIKYYFSSRIVITILIALIQLLFIVLSAWFFFNETKLYNHFPSYLIFLQIPILVGFLY